MSEELKIGGAKTSKKKLIEMVDWQEPTYFVGYGSLMYPSGINGRGMEYYYRWKDLIPVEIQGIKRSFCAVFKELAFYGIYEHKGSEINAVAFKIHSRHDYAMLLADEGAHPIFDPPMYNMLNVADRVTGYNFSPDTHQARVMILEGRHVDEKNGYIPEYYVHGTWNGIKHWGEEFRQRFLETGGMAYKADEYKVYVPNPWRGNKILCSRRRDDRGSEIPCKGRE